jgi:hypothetical protein
VVSEKSVRLAIFALTFALLYHTFHAQNHRTRNFLCVEVASCACLGKPPLRYQLIILQRNIEKSIPSAEEQISEKA